LTVRLLACLLALSFAGTATAQSDAEAQFRVARRLAAEGSPQAAAALDRVYQLDPDGPFADDALLERAGLVGLPAWPEDLGRLTAIAAGEARPYLSRIVRDLRSADRAPEAAYRLALLSLEPLPGHDAQQARLELLSLAAGTGPDAHASRYSLAWLAEQRGDLDQAEAAYQRLRVDVPGSEAAVRATFAVGRVRLRQGRPDAAAARLQQALLAGSLDAGLSVRARALRDVAVDALLARVRTTESFRVAAGSRPSAIAVAAGGGALVASRKTGTVIEFDASGAEIDRWTVEQPLSVARNPNGLRVAITAAAVLRLDPGGGATVLGAPGDLGAFSAGVIDGLGRVWVLDRKGDRIGLFEVGVGQPRTVWSGDGTRLSSLVWDGNRLLALDTRERSVVAITTAGASSAIVTGTLERPSALAADPAGRIAVLDSKGSIVRFYDASGASLGQFAPVSSGIQRPTGLALGCDGSLHLVEEASGLWWGSR
jgi:DNA-binding beta-propeller fold protein YncE